MHPAFSVIFLTTLIGVGQGLFLALYTGQLYALANLIPQSDSAGFYGAGSILALVFLVGGLIASFFHLGHPERGWRAVARWRTSWLSREVIVLPAFMGVVFLYGVVHMMNWDFSVFVISGTLTVSLTLLLGAIGTVLAFALFLCTGMIYACIKFLQEWHSPLTVINYTLLGSASGFTLAAAFSAWQNNALVGFFGNWAVLLTIAALVFRIASLMRNGRIKPKSSMQTALGIRHTHIEQKSMGFMGGSFNTREYFHGASKEFFDAARNIFLVLVFPVPVVLLALSSGVESVYLPFFAFLLQYLGLLFERWYFFADANHPQNMYYQTVG